MKALISIDYTYDFVADDGKLTTGKAGQVIEQAVTTHTKSLSKRETLWCLRLMRMTHRITSILKINYFLRIT